MPFVKDEWTRFVANRLLITLLHTLCECQIKTRCDGMQFCLFKSHLVVQTEATVNPTEGLFLCTDTEDLCCLSPSTGTPWATVTSLTEAGHLHTDAKPGQGQGSVWNVRDPVPRTYIFCCLFSGFSFTVFTPNLFINKEGSPAHTHTSLSSNINNSRGHHCGFSGFLKVWSRMAVGSLKRNVLSTSQGWIPIR